MFNNRPDATAAAPSCQIGHEKSAQTGVVSKQGKGSRLINQNGGLTQELLLQKLFLV